jgi:UDP-N-acetylmuramoyl-L-alanyl-D-glutamate--2,6-diaminopimelate ligase
MEVSSHGIAMGRLRGCRFAVRVLTGIGHDHLDFHGDFDRYVATKLDWLLETRDDAGAVVAPIDQPHGRRVIAALGDRATSFGFDAGAAVHVQSLTLDDRSSRGVLATPAGALAFDVPLTGRHNIRNVMAAVAVALRMEISLDDVARGLARCPAVPGRLEEVPNRGGARIFVDYAHTPDALEAVLGSLRELARGRLIAVFGCGGDRDPSKRPVMAEIGHRLADLVVLTSDNPRSEPPAQILADMTRGLPAGPLHSVIVEPDRREAIRHAIELACATDIVIVAGKGHETYQIVGSREHPFDDRQVIRELVRTAARPAGAGAPCP